MNLRWSALVFLLAVSGTAQVAADLPAPFPVVTSDYGPRNVTAGSSFQALLPFVWVSSAA